MKFLVQGASGRRISWLLVTTLVLPLLVMAWAPRSARAQLTRTPQVAVIDFTNLAGGPSGSILGRQATDAVVVEMTRTGRFDVTPRSQLNQQLQDLGLTLPLDIIGIQKLGQALGVDFVATGSITSVTFLDSPRRAQVTVSVRLTDVVSGELANGAIQSGVSPTPPAGLQADDDYLINQGISNAAFNAVRTISNYSLPEATILSTRDQGEVILNRGGRDGITTGLEMIVIRGSDRIGKLRVTTVGSTDSSAVITDGGKGIRPEDRARAIFRLPGYSPDLATGTIRETPIRDVKEYTPQKGRRKSIVGTVLGVAAALLLLAFVTRKSTSTNSSGATGIRARSYAEVSSISQDPTAARVEIRWDGATDIPGLNLSNTGQLVPGVLEFQIFRDNVIIGSVPGTQRFFIDSPQLLGDFFYYNVDAQGIPNFVRTTATPLQVGVPHQYRIAVVYQRVVAVPPGEDNNNNNNNNQPPQGNPGPGQPPVTPPNLGVDENAVYARTPVSSPSGLATAIARPDAISPNVSTDQALNRVRFTFQTTQGANQYIIELARDPSFANKVTLGPFRFPYSPSGNTTTQDFNLTSSFPANQAGPGTRIFWRVGGRNETDSPGPISPGTPNGNDYVYSAQDTQFNIVEFPPNPLTPGTPVTPGTPGTTPPPAPGG